MLGCSDCIYRIFDHNATELHSVQQARRDLSLKSQVRVAPHPKLCTRYSLGVRAPTSTFNLSPRRRAVPTLYSTQSRGFLKKLFRLQRIRVAPDQCHLFRLCSPLVKLRTRKKFCKLVLLRELRFGSVYVGDECLVSERVNACSTKVRDSR